MDKDRIGTPVPFGFSWTPPALLAQGYPALTRGLSDDEVTWIGDPLNAEERAPRKDVVALVGGVRKALGSQRSGDSAEAELKDYLRGGRLLQSVLAAATLLPKGAGCTVATALMAERDDDDWPHGRWCRVLRDTNDDASGERRLNVMLLVEDHFFGVDFVDRICTKIRADIS